MNILVTGGAGYIGSHTVIEILKSGHEVTVLDNLSNSTVEPLERVQRITGKRVEFREVDVRNKPLLDAVFREFTIDAVIHFAGLKAVGESVENPLLYFDNNVSGSIALLEVMATHNVYKLVFSSSATVYGNAPYPYVETATTGVGIANPYGQTKYIVEEILRDTADSNKQNQFVSLRYFNPVGAHESGILGEDPLGIPNNLMPYIAQAAVGKRDKLRIFGNDYDTVDGTGVRDYVHVVDLAKGHVAALHKISSGFDAINLGTGRGTSVFQLLNTFEKVCGKTIPYEIEERRAGDLAEYYADISKAQKLLGWHAERTLEDMCADTWRWQSQNPNGYK